MVLEMFTSPRKDYAGDGLVARVQTIKLKLEDTSKSLIVRPNYVYGQHLLSDDKRCTF